MGLMNQAIEELADVTDENARTFDLGYALLARIPSTVAARALVDICAEHEIDWAREMGMAGAAEVRRLADGDVGAMVRVATPYGDLVARGYDDDGAYMGIVVDLEKPDGTSGQVSMTEAVSGPMRDCYATPVHTFAWDGRDEEMRASVDLDPEGPEMDYPYRGSER